MLGRRPQRQVARLRAGLGARHRPPPDRDVFAADPHRRPHRRPAARRHGRLRRVPLSCLGGHRHRRAETMGDALHRAEREEPARLVWRGDRHGQFQRRHEHRPDASHHPHQGRHRRGARRRHAALRQHSRGRRSRNRTEGIRHDLRHPRRQDRQCRRCRTRHRARRRRRQHPSGRPRGLIRPHAGQLFPPDRRQCLHRAHACAGGSLRAAEARSRRAFARSRHAEGLRLRRDHQESRAPATCRSSASASACRRWPRLMAAN